jgi:hypothetical protein
MSVKPPPKMNGPKTPDVGYTLISIGNLDDKGFSATFEGGKCVITGPDGEQVGEIPKNRKGLYRVEDNHEMANPAEEKITLDQFHRRMGHISPETARKLVQKRFITCLHLSSLYIHIKLDMFFSLLQFLYPIYLQ